MSDLTFFFILLLLKTWLAFSYEMNDYTNIRRRYKYNAGDGNEVGDGNILLREDVNRKWYKCFQKSGCIYPRIHRYPFKKLKFNSSKNRKGKSHVFNYGNAKNINENRNARSRKPSNKHMSHKVDETLKLKSKRSKYNGDVHQEKKGLPKSSWNLWNLEEVFNDLSQELSNVKLSEMSVFGELSLPSLVRNIEPTDDEAFIQYMNEKQIKKGIETYLFEENDKSKRHKKTVFEHKEISSLKKKSVQYLKYFPHRKKQWRPWLRKKDQGINSRKEKKRNVEAMDHNQKHKIEKKLEEPIINAAGTNVKGLMELEIEQELAEERLPQVAVDKDERNKIHNRNQFIENVF